MASLFDRWLSALVAGALALALATPARVQADDAAMSRFHYQQATQHYSAARWERAIQQFFLAQRLSPNPRTLYNIALCFRQLRRHAEAFQFMSEYLDQTDETEGFEARRAFAERTLEELTPRVSRVSVVSEPAGARIFVDQREHGTWGQTPRVLALAPGEHTLWVELDGYEPATATVTATPGERVEASLRPAQIVGQVHVRADHAGRARLIADGGAVVAEGALPLDARVPPGRYDVEVIAEGFRPFHRVASVVANGESRLTARLERLPPPMGTLTVSTNVRGSVVEVDGEPAGFTPLTLPGLEPRLHHVTVSAPEQLPWEQEVQLEADTQTWLQVSLVEEPQGRSPFTWALSGGSVLFFGTAAITGARALARRRSFDDRVGTLDAGDLRSNRDRGRALSLTTDVLLGLGLASLTAGLVLYFVTDDSSDRTSTATVSGSEQQ